MRHLFVEFQLGCRRISSNATRRRIVGQGGECSRPFVGRFFPGHARGAPSAQPARRPGCRRDRRRRTSNRRRQPSGAATSIAAGGAPPPSRSARRASACSRPSDDRPQPRGDDLVASRLALRRPAAPGSPRLAGASDDASGMATEEPAAPEAGSAEPPESPAREPRGNRQGSLPATRNLRGRWHRSVVMTTQAEGVAFAAEEYSVRKWQLDAGELKC